LVYTPKNTQSVELRFRGEKTTKVVGQLAAEKPAEGNILSGILVRRNFKLHMMAPEDLQSCFLFNAVSHLKIVSMF